MALTHVQKRAAYDNKACQPRRQGHIRTRFELIGGGGRPCQSLIAPSVAAAMTIGLPNSATVVAGPASAAMERIQNHYP